jgi:hypothetical protein
MRRALIPGLTFNTRGMESHDAVAEQVGTWLVLTWLPGCWAM